MIRILLLALSVCSLESTAGVTLGQLKWQPNLITKQSVLADHEDLSSDESSLFTDIPQLAFITDWSERGYVFALMNANNINYVSFVWFFVVPKYSDYGRLSDVEVLGTQSIRQEYIQELRMVNPNIKIVPRFEFKNFSPDEVKTFVQTEWLGQRCGQTIANFCHEHGLDGAVIECTRTLSEGILSEGRFVENDRYIVDLYRDMTETLEQVGKAIRENGLTAIFSITSPVTLINMEYNLEKEAHISSFPPQFSRQMMNAYDYVHLWYLERTELINRQYIHDRFLEKIMKFYDYSPKLLIGINFYGHEFPLDDYRKGGNGKKWDVIAYQRFLDVLEKDDAVLTFNEVNKEHELISESANSFIIYPSLTQLEYRLARIKQHPGVGIAIWEYGQGLNYFTNLV